MTEALRHGIATHHLKLQDLQSKETLLDDEMALLWIELTNLENESSIENLDDHLLIENMEHEVLYLERLIGARTEEQSKIQVELDGYRQEVSEIQKKEQIGPEVDIQKWTILTQSQIHLSLTSQKEQEHFTVTLNMVEDLNCLELEESDLIQQEKEYARQLQQMLIESEQVKRLSKINQSLRDLHVSLHQKSVDGLEQQQIVDSFKKAIGVKTLEGVRDLKIYGERVFQYLGDVNKIQEYLMKVMGQDIKSNNQDILFESLETKSKQILHQIEGLSNLNNLLHSYQMEVNLAFKSKVINDVHESQFFHYDDQSISILLTIYQLKHLNIQETQTPNLLHDKCLLQFEKLQIQFDKAAGEVAKVNSVNVYLLNSQFLQPLRDDFEFAQDTFFDEFIKTHITTLKQSQRHLEFQYAAYSNNTFAADFLDTLLKELLQNIESLKNEVDSFISTHLQQALVNILEKKAMYILKCQIILALKSQHRERRSILLRCEDGENDILQKRLTDTLASLRSQNISLKKLQRLQNDLDQSERESPLSALLNQLSHKHHETKKQALLESDRFEIESHATEIDNERRLREEVQIHKQLVERLQGLDHDLKKLEYDIKQTDTLEVVSLRTQLQALLNILRSAKSDCLKSEWHTEGDQIEAGIQLKRQQMEVMLVQQEATNTLIKKIDSLINHQFPHKERTFKQKLDYLEQNLLTLEQGAHFMLSDDYIHRKVSTERLIESIQDLKELKRGLRNDHMQVRSLVPILESNWNSYCKEELEGLMRQCQRYQTEQEPINQTVDTLLTILSKLRQKLGDGNIPDLIKQRRQQLRTLHLSIGSCESDIAFIFPLIQVCEPDVLLQLQGISNLLAKISEDRDLIESRLAGVRDWSKEIDLNYEDADKMLEMMSSIMEIGQKLTQRDLDMENITKQVAFLKTKYSGMDYINKIQSLIDATSDAQLKIKTLKQQAIHLQELCEESTGYSSDKEEDDFIKRLGNADLREINTMLRPLSDINLGISDQLQALKKSDLKNIAVLGQVDEVLKGYTRDILEIEKKMARHMKQVEKLNGQEKMEKRALEIDELERRFDQMQAIIDNIEMEYPAQMERAEIDPSKKGICQELADFGKDLEGMKLEFQSRLVKCVVEARNLLANTFNNSQLDSIGLLKMSKRVKKQVQSILKSAQAFRKQFKDLRNRYESCKLRLKTIVKYTPKKGDDVDRLISDWVNSNGCPIPISRCGNGYYTFGSKKIFAKITNGNLVIRVGGGYMGIDEFMYYYGAQELNKMLAYEDFDAEDEIDLDKLIDGKVNKGVVIGGAQLKKRFSPRHLMNGKSPNIIGVSPMRVAPIIQQQNTDNAALRKSHNSPRSLLDNYNHQNSFVKIQPSNLSEIRRSSPKPSTLTPDDENTAEYYGLGVLNGKQQRPTLKVRHDTLSSFDSGSQENESGDNKSKILDLIRQRKATESLRAKTTQSQKRL